MNGPLEGLRVLDLATIIAAPLSATLLADYGADVVKVELPSGDGLRNFPPLKDELSIWWKTANRGKRFVTLDLRTPDGVRILKSMLPHFDVLIENFRPGTLDRWGLSKEVLWEVQPSLVILRTTAFGQDGPYRDRPGFARVFEAMGGLTYITGEADGPPMHPGYPLGDAIGGLFGALGILAALWKRARNKEAAGEEIDLSLTEAVFRLLDYVPIAYDQLGTVQKRTGNVNPYSAPASVFRTADDHWITLAGSTNAVFARNCQAIGKPELAQDPRFSTNPSRVKHSSELNAVFAEWCGEHALDDVLAAFESAGGTIAPIYDIEQIFNDPQMQARKAIVSIPDPDFGEVRMQNVVPRYTGDPCQVGKTAGALGSDNAEVFGRLLGMDEATLAHLAERGVI